jgi:hypothetical protein
VVNYKYNKWKMTRTSSAISFVQRYYLHPKITVSVLSRHILVLDTSGISLQRCLHNWRIQQGIFFPNMNGSVICGLALLCLSHALFILLNTSSRVLCLVCNNWILAAVCILSMQRLGLILVFEQQSVHYRKRYCRKVEALNLRHTEYFRNQHGLRSICCILLLCKIFSL